MSEKIDGLAGSAEPIDRSKAPHPEASIAFWLLHLPGLHPVWDHYALSCVDLKDRPGMPEAIKQYPEAEFEIMFCGVDSSRDPKADDIESIKFLHPLNYVEQFHGISYEEAGLVARVLVKAFVDGKLHPEPTGIVGARNLFRKTLDLTLEIAEEERGKEAVP